MTAYIHSYEIYFRHTCADHLEVSGYNLVSFNPEMDFSHFYSDVIIYDIPSFAKGIPFFNCKLLALMSASNRGDYRIPQDTMFFRKPVDVSYMIEVVTKKHAEMLMNS